MSDCQDQGRDRVLGREKEVCGYKRQQERPLMELFCILTGDGYMNLHVIKLHKTQTHEYRENLSQISGLSMLIYQLCYCSIVCKVLSLDER